MSAEGARDEVVPIACTLQAGDLPDRLTEWQAFFASSVISSEAAATSVRLLLDPSDATLLIAASLAQREKRCCAFFDFALLLEAEERWLSVAVPTGAEETLATFLEMLRSGTGPSS